MGDAGAECDPHAAFRQEVRDWLGRAIPSEWRQRPATMSLDEIVEHRRRWGEIVHAGGYSGLSWPVEYGGRGCSPVEVAIFYEECARAHAPEELNRLGRNLVGPAIIGFGTEEQKRRFLPGLRDGSEIWCEGFSEPNAGSDLAAVATTASWDGTRYVVNGSKIWTSFAQLAGRIYLLAKTSPDAPRHHNLTILLMNLRQPGVTVRPLRQITGRPEFNQLFFDDCVAWPDEVLGEVNDGWRLATIGAGGLRAAAAGASTWHHYVEMVGWVDRIEEGGRLQGTVNPRVAEFRDQLSLLWWHVARCSDMVAGSSGFLPPAGAAQVIKLHWSELAQRIVAEGLRASPPEHREFWRDAYLEARPTTIYGGSSQLRRNVLADHVLKLRKR